ncbi:class I SAM-dependent DNA methyltransferase [Paenarthrobacter nicotinovorans]|uniref:class I SAM-dependent DNA methyltransferase n=1 Tax=Paenarthrobacter nicotinovorans TaxID=29320 RepID=UPI0038070681
MTSKFLAHVDKAEFKHLFIEELGWDQPTAKALTVDVEDASYNVTPIAGFHGLHVWACDSLPDRSTQAQIDREVSAISTERLIIFHNGTKQEWRWPRYNKNRGTNMSKLLVHEHTVGTDHSALERRLEKIALDIEDDISLVQLLEKMRTAFDVEESEESSKAAKVMAKLYYELEAHLPQTGPETSDNLHKISVTMTRILFLVFADDTMMWDEENLFQNFIAFETEKDGSDLTPKLEQLFHVLNTDKKARPDLTGHLARFKYVNGGIFSEPIKLPPLGSKMRELLIEASRFDWGNISPAIFGSMFQAVKSKELRRELGAHYTSEKDILKTLRPLFLDELHEEFERTKTLANPTRPLRALRERLGSIKVLDPACGCGNFLIVAYRELRELELQIMEALQEHKGDDGVRTLDATLDLRVSLGQIYGIEIDEWPARIAETALHLIDRQCNLRLIEKFGHAPERLPITEAARIHTSSSADPNGGNALRLDWSTIFDAGPENVIVGNPPFVGISLRTAEQTADLKRVWGLKYHGSLDFVTAWYKKAVDYARGTATRIALVSTNSICQGEQVSALWQYVYDAGFSIDFAHRTFAWKSEAQRAAAVHVIIIGLIHSSAASSKRTRRLFEYESLVSSPVLREVTSISPYLVEGPELPVTPRTSGPISGDIPDVKYGSKPTDDGNLIVKIDDYPVFTDDPVAAKYLRKYIGAKELLHDLDRWCLWMSGPEFLSTDIAASPLLSQRVEAVRQFRLDSKAPSTVQKAREPHKFVQIGQPAFDYVCIPQHISENHLYFPVRHEKKDVIASNACFVAQDPEGMLFAVISSSWFMVWQDAIGGRIKSDYRFNKFLAWNTFPLPALSPESRRLVIEAGKAVLEARRHHPTESLATLYNTQSMHSDLLAAHHALDLVLDRVLAPRRKIRNAADRLEVLFSGYVRMLNDEQLVNTVPARARR